MDVYAFEISSVFSPAGLFDNLGNLISSIIQLMITAGAVLCIIFIIVGGFKFITAAGDEKSIASAKATLTYAIIGLIVILLAFIIVQVVQYFLGSTIQIIG